mgnify:CR=1 FL=1
MYSVNDFRYRGDLIPYAADTTKLGQKVGYKVHDIVIWKVGTMTVTYALRNDDHKFTAKVHETLVVFRK